MKYKRKINYKEVLKYFWGKSQVIIFLTILLALFGMGIPFVLFDTTPNLLFVLIASFIVALLMVGVSI